MNKWPEKLLTESTPMGESHFSKMYLGRFRPATKEQVDACKHESITIDPNTNLDATILYGTCNSCAKHVRTTQKVTPRY